MVIIYHFKIRLAMPSFKHMRELLGFSAPIAVYNGLRSLVDNLSPIILAFFTTTVIVGNYGVALKVVNVLGLATASLTAALLPMFASTLALEHLNKEINKFYNYSIYLTFVLMVPAMFYIAMLSKQLSYTAFSARYLLVPNYLVIISIGMLFWIVAQYTTYFLIGRNLVREVLKYSVMIAIMEFILIFTLIPLFKGFGLVFMAYTITPVVMSCLSVMVARRRLGVVLDTKKLIRVIIAGIISAVPLFLLTHLVSSYTVIIVLGVNRIDNSLPDCTCACRGCEQKGSGGAEERVPEDPGNELDHGSAC